MKGKYLWALFRLVGDSRWGGKGVRRLRILVNPGVDPRVNDDHIFRLAKDLAFQGHWITYAAPRQDLKHTYPRGIRSFTLGNDTAHHEPIRSLKTQVYSAGQATSFLGEAIASYYSATFTSLDKIGHVFDGFICDATAIACRDVAKSRGIRMIITSQAASLLGGPSGLLPVPFRGAIGQWIMRAQLDNHIKPLRKKHGIHNHQSETPLGALILVDAFQPQRSFAKSHMAVSFRRQISGSHLTQLLPFLSSHKAILIISLQNITIPSSTIMKIEAAVQLALDQNIIDGVLVNGVPDELVSLGPSIGINDYIGHPSLKLAITLGDSDSIQFSILCKVPMLLFPFNLDQPNNAKFLESHNLGLIADPLSEPLHLVQMIKTLAEDKNTTFKRSLQAASSQIMPSTSALTLIQNYILPSSNLVSHIPDPIWTNTPTMKLLTLFIFLGISTSLFHLLTSLLAYKGKSIFPTFMFQTCEMLADEMSTKESS
ncbi:hypothetical protein DSO57_1005897 [Entomophthora muscae]|uniref:Uncharacterized protein n=1 Tax=Entomophthora muscae TaxID=34485 RepID=A0ACC2S9Z2_9FUNG|nr:hypothetical protein DSO57_1005897 [Entomophthora muscae]